ncbi:MAG: hypothetical protein WDM96_16300 [Lacunisphaera sp.]
MKVPGLRSDYVKVGGLRLFRAHARQDPAQGSGVNCRRTTSPAPRTARNFDARCTRFLRVDYEALTTRVKAGGHRPPRMRSRSGTNS